MRSWHPQIDHLKNYYKRRRCPQGSRRTLKMLRYLANVGFWEAAEQRCDSQSMSAVGRK